MMVMCFPILNILSWLPGCVLCCAVLMLMLCCAVLCCVGEWIVIILIAFFTIYKIAGLCQVHSQKPVYDRATIWMMGGELGSYILGHYLGTIPPPRTCGSPKNRTF